MIHYGSYSLVSMFSSPEVLTQLTDRAAKHLNVRLKIKNLTWLNYYLKINKYINNNNYDKCPALPVDAVSIATGGLFPSSWKG